MMDFPCIGKEWHRLCSSLRLKLLSFIRSFWYLASCSYRFIQLQVNPFWIQLCYFLFISFLGFWVLKGIKPRTADSFIPRNLDLFFTSVSATTVSSMSTVEMEVFSNSQLILLTILMFIGGEVFTSMVGLHLTKSKIKTLAKISDDRIPSVRSESSLYEMELGGVIIHPNNSEIPETGNESIRASPNNLYSSDGETFLKYDSVSFLGLVVFGYLMIVHVVGVSLVSVYLALVPSARNVLKKKELKLSTFSVFTTVSTFASCGFVPTNENMMVFSSNSGLLLILIPQVLLGNTLFPPCLRFSIWVLGKFCKKKETNYLLKNRGEIGYLHLLPGQHSSLLVATVLGFVLVQFMVFCSTDWNSDALNGLDFYQKVVGILFETVNTRHTGETIVDISTLSAPILVLFVVMMYLPPYTSIFFPLRDASEHVCTYEKRKKRKGKVLEIIIMSQLSYLVIFVILVCITERGKMKEYPLNFNVFNIVLEVISAYGNVGFTMGYSCDRLLKPDRNCNSKWYGFVGKWSDGGKIILIMVMFFGRLKKFNMDGGRAWILL